MSQALLQMLACGAPSQVIYADDVFSAYTYTGNGSTQTINNGIDLAGKGGMVWLKSRITATDDNNGIFDTARGAGSRLVSNSTLLAGSGYGQTFSSTGFSVTDGSTHNQSTITYVSWTFRKAPKFFDVVTWTGNATNRTISHSLGQEVGLIFVKRTDSAADWQVYHRSLANTEYMVLNSTAAKATGATRWNSTTPTTSVFSVGTDSSVNASGGTYVAYLFAHDTGTDGIVQCGSYTGNGATTQAITLGWEPQYILFRNATDTANWAVTDSSIGMPATSSQTHVLQPNTTNAELTGQYLQPAATGFIAENAGLNTSGKTYIYLAIRRPNKPPTAGTQVYNAITRTGTGAVATVTGVGFAPDLVMPFNRSGVAGVGHPVYDRLRGALKSLRANLTNGENSDTASLTAFGMDGMTLGADGAEYINSSRESSIINHFFKRAAGVFDVVCYTGTGANHTESHSLGVAPELWIIKDRSAANDWAVGCTALANTEYMALNATDAKATGATYWNSTYPTASVFSLGTMARVNTSTNKYVAYLFATKAGISKVGSYTGTATTNAIDCGFTTGARFVLIKRTDSTGDWYVWDTVRGIIAGNDPYLLLNSTAAEVTSTDYIDPYTSGFELSSTAPAAINASGGTYIYLAFA